MLGFSFQSTIQILLPPTNDNTSLLNIIVYISDSYSCITEYNISSIYIEIDLIEMNNFIEKSVNSLFIKILESRNQNLVSQVITSLSIQFNQINNEIIENALISKTLFIHFI